MYTLIDLDYPEYTPRPECRDMRAVRERLEQMAYPPKFAGLDHEAQASFEARDAQDRPVYRVEWRLQWDEDLRQDIWRVVDAWEIDPDAVKLVEEEGAS